MDIHERIKGVEVAQIQIGMDMQYVKGRLEDMPTKDWVNGRFLVYTGGLATLIIIGLTIIGFLIKS